MGHRIRMMLGVLIALMLLVSACGGAAPTATPAPPKPTATTPPTSTPVPPTPTKPPAQATATAAPQGGQQAGTAQEELLGSFMAFSKVKTFRVKMESLASTAGQPLAGIATLEVVLPNRAHLTMEGMEAVIISGTTYFKIGGQWQKVEGGEQNFLSLLDFADIQKTAQQQLKDVVKVGNEILDGVPTTAYTYTEVSTSTSAPVQVKLWVGLTDRLPRKIEITEGGKVTTRMTYYDYNAPFTIEAPIP